MGECHCACCESGGRSGRILAVCVQHITVGCCDVSRPGQPGQLVALSRRRSGISGVPDDLVAAARSFQPATVDCIGQKGDLDSGPFVPLRNGVSGNTVSASSGGHERLAALRGVGTRFRRDDRERRYSTRAQAADCTHPSLHRRAQFSLSGKHGVTPGGVCRGPREFFYAIRLVCCHCACVADGSRAGLDLGAALAKHCPSGKRIRQ